MEWEIDLGRPRGLGRIHLRASEEARPDCVLRRLLRWDTVFLFPRYPYLRRLPGLSLIPCFLILYGCSVPRNAEQQKSLFLCMYFAMYDFLPICDFIYRRVLCETLLLIQLVQRTRHFHSLRQIDLGLYSSWIFVACGCLDRWIRWNL